LGYAIRLEKRPRLVPWQAAEKVMENAWKCHRLFRSSLPFDISKEVRTNAAFFSMRLLRRPIRGIPSCVAAIYDIHANLSAFEAVLQEIRQAKVDCVVVGGDVLPGPLPRETIQCLLDLDIPCSSSTATETARCSRRCLNAVTAVNAVTKCGDINAVTNAVTGDKCGDRRAVTHTETTTVTNLKSEDVTLGTLPHPK
jgi:hypothetical protein